jgi:hypothetical protein
MTLPYGVSASLGSNPSGRKGKARTLPSLRREAKSVRRAAQASIAA